MKTEILFSTKILLIFFILIVFGSSALFAEEQTIRLGYSDAEAFPYQIRHDNNPPGIAFEIISEAAKQTGIKVTYVKLPNKRVLFSLQEGVEIDGAFMFSYDESRTVNGVYPFINDKPDGSRKIATLSYHIYKKKGSPLKWDGNNISGIDTANPENKIGANSGYSVVKDLTKKGVPVDDGSKTTKQNFLKLLSGRISGFAHQDLVADNYILTNKLSGIEKLPKPFIQKNYFLMFSHQYYGKNRKIAEKLWNKIGEIRERKTAAVFSKYKD